MPIRTIKTGPQISFGEVIHSEHLMFFFHPAPYLAPLFLYLFNWLEFINSEGYEEDEI